MTLKQFRHNERMKKQKKLYETHATAHVHRENKQ